MVLLMMVVLSVLGAGMTMAQEGNVEAGKKLYQTICAVCHGPEGKADTPTAKALPPPKPRDHTDGAYMNQLSNEHLTKVIKEGGQAVGKSPNMPGQPQLNEQQLRDLIAFIRSLASPPYKGN